MSVLTISLVDLRRLCGLVIGDTSADADFSALIAAEQAVIEYQLDPTQLAAVPGDSGLAATLTLGVGEILAGRYLQQQARSPGALDDFHLGPLVVTSNKTVNSLALAQTLSQHGAARIAPFGRSPNVPPGAQSAAKNGAIAPSELLAVPPTSDGLNASTSALGLFGSLQQSALGSDDSEPPAEFSVGYVSLSDPSQLGDT